MKQRGLILHKHNKGLALIAYNVCIGRKKKKKVGFCPTAEMNLITGPTAEGIALKH